MEYRIELILYTVRDPNTDNEDASPIREEVLAIAVDQKKAWSFFNLVWGTICPDSTEAKEV